MRPGRPFGSMCQSHVQKRLLRIPGKGGVINVQCIVQCTPRCAFLTAPVCGAGWVPRSRRQVLHVHTHEPWACHRGVASKSGRFRIAGCSGAASSRPHTNAHPAPDSGCFSQGPFWNGGAHSGAAQPGNLCTTPPPEPLPGQHHCGPAPGRHWRGTPGAEPHERMGLCL